MFKELNMNYVDETNPAELMDTAIKAMLNDLYLCFPTAKNQTR
jgi:carboxyl-terminal processing protease